MDRQLPFVPIGQRFMRRLNAARPALLACAAGQQPCSLAIKNCQVVNVFTGETYPGEIWVKDGWIVTVTHPDDGPARLTADQVVDAGGRYAVPGFVDTHVHVESTMLTPRGFGETLAAWGTTTTMADPHEIVNVAGAEGFRYMWESAKHSPLRQYFLIPSCIPAVPHLEHAGAAFGPGEIAQLFDEYPETPGLAEVMDYFGLIGGDPRMTGIVREAIERGAFVQGHCFGFSGTNLARYLLAGPQSNHESLSEKDVLALLRDGGNLNLRVSSSLGSNELFRPLVNALKRTAFRDRVSLCTDDVHIGDILRDGHLNASIQKVIEHSGLNPVEVIRIASLNGWREYGVDCAGALAPGYVADIVLLENGLTFSGKPHAVFVDGKLVASKGELARALPPKSEGERTFEQTKMGLGPVSAQTLLPRCETGATEVTVNAIVCQPDGISTGLAQLSLPVEKGTVALTGHPDLCYITVFNRYGTGRNSTGVIQNFGLKAGAIASTVAHDGHNLIVVYRDAESAVTAVNGIIRANGGIAYVDGNGQILLQQLEVGGLMTTRAPAEAAADIDGLCATYAAQNGGANAMTIATRSLTVLPTAVITDLGIVDTIGQKFVPFIV